MRAAGEGPALGLPEAALPVAIVAALAMLLVVVARSLWGGSIALTATSVVGCVAVLLGLVMITAQVFILPVFMWGLVVVTAGSLLVIGAVRAFWGRHRDAPSDTDGEYPLGEPAHDPGAAP